MPPALLERLDAYCAETPDPAWGNRPNRGRVIELAVTRFLDRADRDGPEAVLIQTRRK